jgi:hypothetical protein
LTTRITTKPIRMNFSNPLAVFPSGTIRVREVVLWNLSLATNTFPHIQSPSMPPLSNPNPCWTLSKIFAYIKDKMSRLKKSAPHDVNRFPFKNSSIQLNCETANSAFFLQVRRKS